MNEALFTEESFYIVDHYRVCGLWLGPNFGGAADDGEKFWGGELTFEEKHAFEIFTENYLGSCGCSETNFMATVNCRN